ncbi:hypothetical protein Hanom_Chr04g00345741 [Helianthus anomalus]
MVDMHLVAEVGRHATLFAIASATVAIDNYALCKLDSSPPHCNLLLLSHERASILASLIKLTLSKSIIYIYTYGMVKMRITLSCKNHGN